MAAIGWDDRVPFTENTCPASGSLHWGRIRVSIKTDSESTEAPPEYAYAKTIGECAIAANDLLVETNALVKEKRGDWDSRKTARYVYGRQARQDLLGDPEAPLQKVYWSYTDNPYADPYGASCRIYWDCDGTTEEKGYVSGESLLSDGGKSTYCTVPQTTDNCITNKVTGAPPAQCTPLAMKDSYGDNCRMWYDALPDDIGNVTKATVSQAICTKYPYLDECKCLNRDQDPIFKRLIHGGNSTISDICWYLGCKMPGFDRRITPDMDKARNTCTAELCQNIVQVIDSIDIDVMAAEQATDCKATTGGSGESIDSTNTESAIKSIPLTIDEANDTASRLFGMVVDSDGMSTGIIILIVVGSVIGMVVFALIAYYLLKRKNV